MRDTADLPPYILDELPNLPRNADRKALADIITRLLSPVSDRSLEVWPLKWRRVNGHSLAATEDAEFTWRKFAAAPVMKGGRQFMLGRLRTTA